MSDRILIIDDDRSLREILEAVLVDAGYETFAAANGTDGLRLASEKTPDLVLLDLRMPDIEGLEVLQKIKAVTPDLVVVMMTAYGSIKTAVEAIRHGAFDFLTKPFDLEELKNTIRNALALQVLTRENHALRTLLHQQTMDFPDITGLSPRIRQVFSVMKRVTHHDVTVLITGESGTGKELVARALHRHGSRSEGPFVAVNCAALSETLLETELFGHEKGAFTGAAGTRPGRFELARGGTLFLDEVGDMSPLMQAKLLRVIQEGEFERVGGSRSIPTDVRLVAATNRDLPAEVAARRFREDLYYRLNVVTIALPPLRDRRDDIPLLVARFLEEFGERYGRKVESVDPAAMACLTAYDWPGNIRELKHRIEQAVLLGEGSVLIADHLPPGVTEGVNSGPRPAECRDLDSVEAVHILGVLKQCGWNRSRASEILGLHRNTLREKIRRFGLGPDTAA
jgi:DNA-binding NtrC family response regulator